MSEDPQKNYVREILSNDINSAKHTHIITRIAAQPCAHIHLGDAKLLCLNYGLAKEFNGVCNLRFDDIYPEKKRTHIY